MDAATSLSFPTTALLLIPSPCVSLDLLSSSFAELTARSLADGIIPSTAPSSDDEDSLPTGSLTAPLEALAQAASEAHIQLDPASGNPSGSGTPVSRGRPRKRRRPMPPPPNAFPDVVTRELVSDATCRQIFAFFIQHCLPFFPILDPSYDTYESMRERTPWSINSIVMVAASRMPDPSPEIRQAAEHGSEEAQGIARSSLFGPTVRPEGCQAMGLVAAWQTSNSPYMASGHSLRMSMELGLHRALGKLAEDAQEGRIRSQTEQRSLVVSARVFLCLYWLDWVLSVRSISPSGFLESAADLLLAHRPPPVDLTSFTKSSSRPRSWLVSSSIPYPSTVTRSSSLNSS